MGNAIKQNKLVRVVILHNEGCPSTPETIALIKSCTADMGIEIDFRKVLVKTRIESDALKFLGSPTVQVNGIDIDPSVRDSKIFGFM